MAGSTYKDPNEIKVKKPGIEVINKLPKTRIGSEVPDGDRGRQEVPKLVPERKLPEIKRD